jgi:hypothetical protein
VWLFYELPNGDEAINRASFYPCDVDNACHIGIPWGVAWITAMFLHASWDHIVGNMCRRHNRKRAAWAVSPSRRPNPARDARMRIVRQYCCAAAMLCENTSPYSAADSTIELPSH